jgi:hypothetical protein
LAFRTLEIRESGLVISLQPCLASRASLKALISLKPKAIKMMKIEITFLKENIKEIQ